MREAHVRAGAAVMIALLAIAGLASAAVPRTETEPYVGTGPPAWVARPVACGNPAANVGGACFALDGSESSASIVVDDLAAAYVPAMASYYTAAGAHLATTPYWFCNAYADFPVPSGARVLVVTVTAPAGSTVCPGLGGSYAAAGTIAVTFT